MATYSELQAQIAALQKEAEEVRKHELQDAINQIKALMDQYGITISDLGGKTGATKRKTSQVKAKYRDPVSGKEWTGRGLMPKWITQSGKDKDAFLIG